MATLVMVGIVSLREDVSVSGCSVEVAGISLEFGDVVDVQATSTSSNMNNDVLLMLPSCVAL